MVNKKETKLWAITVNGKLDPWSISPEKDWVLNKGEKVVRVKIEVL